MGRSINANDDRTNIISDHCWTYHVLRSRNTNYNGNKALTNFITGLDQSSKAVYGFIIGALGCIDFGGPISKVPNLICDGLLLEGITGPEAIKVLAAMVPPLGITFSLVLSKLLKRTFIQHRKRKY